MGEVTVKTIYLGYDKYHLRSLACYDGRTIVCQESERATEVLNGLVAVGERVPGSQPVPYTNDDGVEVVVMVFSPWMYQVPYSDQAWEDLLSIEEAKT